ncbi:CBS domain-containing protein [Aneurinibacillus tyrosinisolvens]|uniref:CBS domain-containing protein n=1 Tax=Aneurinibacillus tyrosinisolvens TaxID=1443435 RepID=UPI0034E2C690
MDEPFSALDPISREQLQQDIQKLQLDIKKTIVFVTHDIDEAMALGDRVCLMRAGEIVQLDIPQNLILHPANPFVQDFIGDRKTPWLTAVDVLCDPHSPHLVSWSAFKQNQIPAVSPLFAEDEEGKLAGEWIGGELVHNPPVLQNDMRLHDALSIMEKYNKDALPVIKHGKIQGVLSYKNIVAYLASKNRQEVGTR